MSPDGLSTVERSWAELSACRQQVLDALTAAYDRADLLTAGAPVLATWLLDAVETLVALLASPSRLEECARAIGATWPEAGTHPTFARDGRVWLDAAAACSACWDGAADRAWRQAWLLLSDVLAAETLSPFADGS